MGKYIMVCYLYINYNLINWILICEIYTNINMDIFIGKSVNVK